MNTRTFQKINLHVLGAALSMVLLFFGTTNVFSAEKGAYDTKIYAGSICRDADENSSNHKATYTSKGYVTNANSNNTLNVVCPLVRDNQATVQGIGAIGIYYTDNHPQEDISCVVIAKRLNGSSWRTSSQMKSQGIGPDVFWQGTPVTTRGADSYFFLKCGIPSTIGDGEPSVIKSIVVTEHKD